MAGSPAIWPDSRGQAEVLRAAYRLCGAHCNATLLNTLTG